MQPTLMFIRHLIYLTVHVDNVFIVGREDKVRDLVRYFKEEKEWNVEEKGPFGQGDKFFYLKRQFNLGRSHCDIERLMDMAGERPDAQYAIQCLARRMSKPAKQALRNAWHACSYLFGAGGYGVRLEERKKGQSMTDFREGAEVEEADQHLLEIVTDSDHAGNKNDRKSTTSMQLYLDGNLIDSKVRS